MSLGLPDVRKYCTVGTTDDGWRKCVEYNGTTFYADDDAQCTEIVARHPPMPAAYANRIVGV